MVVFLHVPSNAEGTVALKCASKNDETFFYPSDDSFNFEYKYNY